jgi:lipopolysaccharide biosynthesis glycosyltransferase
MSNKAVSNFPFENGPRFQLPFRAERVASLGAPPLILACDGEYVMPLATTLRSIVEANRRSWPLEFYVLCCGVPCAAQQRVNRSLPPGSGTVHWVPIDLNLFGQFATIPHVSKMTYARLLIPKIIPDVVRRVLYLDSDLLVLGDLRNLWDSDLKGRVLGAVLDSIDPMLKRGDALREFVPRVQKYFNAGVLMIDLARWRECRISEVAFEYMSRNPRTPYMDQDALNFACDGLWEELNPTWNYHNHFKLDLAKLPSSQRPAIVHFVTSEKPWDASVRNLNGRFYDKFRSRTCFVRNRWDKVVDRVLVVRAFTKRMLKRSSAVRFLQAKVAGEA